ncbi:hypothetical protein M422DRAFT_29007 [Sphaerobolus stellatus SS14]|uniref:Unplaced genomic scaffold SPHSTscaffold_29, whole genome shotgun sequence n=1 Tax=Sphaerobolus stellatus (strain SS14) TaxID=990650 RepID=A0A0C9UVI8_SPHS4|nr:hypothetical protein M422DRAFT_29007 [Sphaerobolus stellatus SS14]
MNAEHPKGIGIFVMRRINFVSRLYNRKKEATFPTMNVTPRNASIFLLRSYMA